MERLLGKLLEKLFHKPEMILPAIGIIVGLVALFIGFLFWMESRAKKRTALAKQFEKEHPAMPGKEEDLAFGALFINATSQARKIEPVRSLEMLFLSKEPQLLTAEDLEPYWDITNTKTAKEALENLKQLHQTSSRPEISDILTAAISRFSEKPRTKAENTSNLNTEDFISYYVLPIIVTKLDDTFLGSYKNDNYSWEELSSVTDIAAWDIERLAGLARKCYVAGYITKEECYNYLEDAKQLAKIHYNSWREYFIGLIYGRALLYDADSIWQYTNIIPRYLSWEDSIWKENEQVWK